MQSLLTKQMRFASHYAAQRIAYQYYQDVAECGDRNLGRVRRQTLDALEAAGFPRCMIQAYDEGSCGDAEILPTRSVMRGDDIEWRALEAYPLAEAQAAAAAGYLELDHVGYWPATHHGHQFAHQSAVRTVRSRIVATQAGGLDI